VAKQIDVSDRLNFRDWPKADMSECTAHPLLGVKRT
jgi:hypothetical protein